MKRIVASALLAGSLMAAPSIRADDIRLEDVSKAARATIEKETEGQQLRELESDTEDGKVVYEAEWRKGDKKFEIKVDEQGRVIERSEGRAWRS